MTAKSKFKHQSLRSEWAESEDTKKIFTPRGEIAQVPVGVKKNRLR